MVVLKITHLGKASSEDQKAADEFYKSVLNIIYEKCFTEKHAFVLMRLACFTRALADKFSIGSDFIEHN